MASMMRPCVNVFTRSVTFVPVSRNCREIKVVYQFRDGYVLVSAQAVSLEPVGCHTNTASMKMAVCTRTCVAVLSSALPGVLR